MISGLCSVLTILRVLTILLIATHGPSRRQTPGQGALDSLQPAGQFIGHLIDSRHSIEQLLLVQAYTGRSVA